MPDLTLPEIRDELSSLVVVLGAYVIAYALAFAITVALVLAVGAIIDLNKGDSL